VKHLGKQEMRNHTIFSLQKSFTLFEELDFSPINCIICFNLVIFAMVDDLHDKMGELFGSLKNIARQI
jgi:brefeldin A-resistance guanine nucleotide exchange factor 1